MPENVSLSDYLAKLRLRAAPKHLSLAMSVGIVCTALGLYMGAAFFGVTGLGLAVAGDSMWARLNQIADSVMDARFDAEQLARPRRLRTAGVLALGLSVIGVLLFLNSFFLHLLGVSTGL
jgi:hypothetical protein